MAKKKLHIYKVGGNVIDNSKEFNLFLDYISRLKVASVVVHGGGKIATAVSKRLGIVSPLIDGRRITNRETLEVVTMVYGGLLNKQLVAQLQKRGVNAIGLSGADGNLIEAHKRPPTPIDFGYVGDIDCVNTYLFNYLLEGGLLPVLCALTHNKEGDLLNTNADTIATAIAVACAETYDITLHYIFDKQGVLSNIDEPSSVIPVINKRLYEEMKQQQAIHSGMLPKLENAFVAIERGVSAIVLAGTHFLIDSERHHGTKLLLQ